MLEPRGALRLRHLNGPQRGTTAVLRPPRSRIGRSRDNDIILADRQGAAASAHHAEAVREGTQWWIHDLQSTHGTSLNGARITRAPIGPGDRLHFGDVECEVLSGRFPQMVAAIAIGALVVITLMTYVITRNGAPNFETVASTVARSVYVVTVERNGRREIAGTAFVVAPGLLATNAHVAAALNASPERPSERAVVIRSDSRDVHPITAVHVSPSWRDGSIAQDVALLRAQLPPDTPSLRLADDATLNALTRGTTVATFGFPASATDPVQPRGRLAVDILGDIREAQYLAVGLRIAPGTSGSPIFLRDGVVVGLVAGGDFEVTKSGERSPSGTNVNWGISVAPLRQLLRDCRAEQR